MILSPLRIVVRRRRFTAAFWAVERAAPRCAGYQVSDALFAVVVEARQHSRLCKMLLANWTCQFVVQFLKAHGEQVTTALRHFFSEARDKLFRISGNFRGVIFRGKYLPTKRSVYGGVVYTARPRIFFSRNSLNLDFRENFAPRKYPLYGIPRGICYIPAVFMQYYKTRKYNLQKSIFCIIILQAVGTVKAKHIA